MQEKMIKRSLLACLVSVSAWVQAQTITLTGNTTSPAQIAAIANGAQVAVSEEGRKQAEKSFAVLLKAAETGQPIYGFTIGVGWNKDRKFVSADGALDKALIDASKAFNYGLIRAHVGAVGEALDERTASAVLATRLNMVLSGHTGLQPEFIHTYVQMLNQDITPLIPRVGSIGQADITVLGHLALNMVGEGEVLYQGERISAKQAFEKAGITAVAPYGKDALALLSTNAYALAVAILANEDLRQLTRLQTLIYALSLEALNGNVSPILADNVRAKGYDYAEQQAQAIRAALEGSYLWQLSDTRAVQDPLSFRDAVWILSTLEHKRAQSSQSLAVQLNHSDDNPTLVPDVSADSDLPEVTKRYVSGGGALFSSSNFDPTPWVIDVEATTIALAHSANAAVQRIIKLNDPNFTHLSRYLGTENTYHAFGAMEKPPVALAREIQLLANPASVASVPVAGNIEDTATHAPLAATRLQKAVENYAYLLGMELIHAAQAIDLRLKAEPTLALGKETRALYEAFRKEVAFLAEDRALSADFETAARFVKNYATAQ